MRPAIFQLRAAEDGGTGFTRQVPGDFQVNGNVVRCFPRLPGHLRDPDDPAGGFYSICARGNFREQPGASILTPPKDPGAFAQQRGMRANRLRFSRPDRLRGAGG